MKIKDDGSENSFRIENVGLNLINQERHEFDHDLLYALIDYHFHSMSIIKREFAKYSFIIL